MICWTSAEIRTGFITTADKDRRRGTAWWVEPRLALGISERHGWVSVVEEEAMATRQCYFADCERCSIELWRPSRSAGQPSASQLSGEARRCEEP
jgi:hypothetical protein